VQAALVDVHCEATSEKMAMGHWCDGRASLVVGTHTHVPTADAMILPGGTAYLTDAGMCGDYNSVIGMEKDEPMRRFITGMGKGRFQAASGEATLSGSMSRPTTARARPRASRWSATADGWTRASVKGARGLSRSWCFSERAGASRSRLPKSR
jgi:hypothetical protein